MTDNWDDSDDEWDANDAELDARLGLKSVEQNLPTFDDEEDLALKDKAANEASQQVEYKKKGTTLAAKKAAEKERLEEIELARKAVELEAEAEANMSPSELKALEQRRIEEADHALTDEMFGGGGGGGGVAPRVAATGDKLVLKDVKDHLKHARRVAEALNNHGKIVLALTFVKEVLEQSKGMFDDDAISDLIKTCNVIKNEKVQESKRKTKGQAQKSKKTDKVAVAKAQKVMVDTFGDNDNYDQHDQFGADYEDAFF
eukprot:CAMPEP_0198142484 /NCGR_PEP_ID=MMETSP1443-20131203/5249_1 /TAXON_ID=186043 /ORGANISM="Entomoneis sp., Strain CCMP2396" /LENGTH=257 /DNA_ID=CAMNT_0043805503 /DNA_START=192 /DNA_END=965 /DNA_ORIENTATION=+